MRESRGRHYFLRAFGEAVAIAVLAVVVIAVAVLIARSWLVSAI